jgi:hypothetical protein
MLKQSLIFLFQPPFFGLTDKYVESVFEQIFVLKYHGGFSITESYNLPIGLREWFVKRLSRQFEEEKAQMDSQMSKMKSKSRAK